MITASQTLSDVLAPRKTLVRDLSLVTGGAALTAICAQISIPLQPIPLTLQTLAVYATGISLGSKRGGAAMALYVGAASMGAPILQGGVSLAATKGQSVGYLAGFIVAALLLGNLAERGWDRKVVSLVGAMVMAEAIILGLGSIWLAPFVGGFGNALKFGVYPFLLPEAIKMVLVCGLLPLAWSFLGKRSGGEQ